MIEYHKPHLERAYAQPDCGCPAEDWILCGLSISIHLEEGHADIFVDAGDWDHEFRLDARSMETAREAAFAWVRALPAEI